MFLLTLILIIGLYSIVRNTDETCDPDAKYRTFDGSCNNLKHPDWGTAGTPFLRASPTRYNYFNGWPDAIDDSPLPNARNLSLNFFPVKNMYETTTLAFMQFGEFIAHDVAMSVHDTNLNCCLLENILYDNCAPISIATDDPFYSQFNVTCLNFVRTDSLISPEGIRQQINGVTHMIDGSQIYGSDIKIAGSLREKICGRLKVSVQDHRKFLPFGEDCESKVCYKSGDTRVNLNLQLTVIQTLFMREHNRIAEKLCKLNYNWDDEKIFQETRRIIISILQHIIYDQYLPQLLNQNTLKRYNLISSNKDGTQYNENIELMVINSFTAGAFRVLHSGIQGILNLINYRLEPVKYLNITDYINAPALIKEHNYFDELILGLITQNMHRVGPQMTQYFNGYFERNGKPYGNDLTATDIQRGRDHGLPSYITMVKLCYNIEINSFFDLVVLIEENDAIKLSEFYSNVEDIDLIVGGSLERRKPGSKLGPTIECIIGTQFYLWKFGDRYFYDIENLPHSFTAEQLESIKNITLARIICDNSDHIQRITRNVFLPPSKQNPLMDCDNINKIDLNLWKD